MYDGHIFNNAAEYAGGMAVHTGGQGIINGGLIEGNYTGQNSSGILVWDSSKLIMNGGKIIKNECNSFDTPEIGGAGILVGNASVCELNKVEISENVLRTDIADRVLTGAGILLTNAVSSKNSELLN